jgi:YD repeat-containing protein
MAHPCLSAGRPGVDVRAECQWFALGHRSGQSRAIGGLHRCQRRRDRQASVLPDGSHEQYDTDGKLVAIIDAEGRALTLTYNDYVQLTQVTGPFGERLQFFYEREPVEKAYRLARILDSTGQAYDYLYDTNQSSRGRPLPGRDPGDDEDNPVRQYHYEDPALPTSLTGITDERGERFATWAYDPRGALSVANTPTPTDGSDSRMTMSMG